MIIGYARVSTLEQSLALQLDALRAAGCEQVYEDMISGSKADRPGLNAALARLDAGDTLVIWKLDRLGRSVQHLVETVNALAARGIAFRSLTDSIDTSTITGKFLFHIMAALAEMERALIRERTMAGLAAAKARGRKGGRRHLMTPSQVERARDMVKAGHRARDVAMDFRVSLPTLYRYLSTP